MMMLKASENFKLLKTTKVEGIPFFLIEHQGREYFSIERYFMKNTEENRREFIDDEWGDWMSFKKGFNQLFDSPPVSGWEALIDGRNCFEGCPLEIGHWDIDLPNLENGESMFPHCRTLTHFSGNLDSLKSGLSMFCGSAISSFESNLPSLENGISMFSNCRNLAAFESSLPVLENGWSMFEGCRTLDAFSTPLPALKIGRSMFKDCRHLSTFERPLPRLKDGAKMFQETPLLNNNDRASR